MPPSVHSAFCPRAMFSGDPALNLVYLGTGWFIGIALASALHLPIEFLLPAFLLTLAHPELSLV